MESTPQSNSFERRQLYAFCTAWTAYCAYYLCRMNLPAAQATIIDEFGLEKSEFGWVITVFAVIYGFGQLINGPLCDRFGARVMLTTGMLGSAAASVGFGFAHSLWAMAALWLINGAFQSMGFAACVKTLVHWFPMRQRGRASGWFSLSYKIGNISAYLISGYLVTRFHWQWAFWAPALVLAVVGLHTLFMLQERPSAQDASEYGIVDISGSHDALPVLDSLKWILTCPALWIVSLSCFFVAVSSYGFLAWLPNYLSDAGATPFMAGAKAACFPLGGCVGAVGAGWVSDRLMGGRRPPIIAAMLLVGGALTAALPFVPNAWPWLRIVAVALTGMMIMGAHAHVVTSVAMDVSQARTTGTATGFIDAMGYMGYALTGVGSGWLAEKWGWQSAFFAWAAATVIGGLLMGLLWRAGASGGKR